MIKLVISEKETQMGINSISSVQLWLNVLSFFYKFSSFYKVKQFQNQFVHLLHHGSVYLNFTVHLVWPNVGHFLRGTYVLQWQENTEYESRV